MKEEIATTDYIAGQEYFILPEEAQPQIRLEIYNEKKQEWRISGFDILIRPHGKKLKTDKNLKIFFTPPRKP